MRPGPKTLQIDEEERFLVRVAWACEIEGITQAQAAERFGVTRLRVNKALGEARRRGLVRVTINSPFAPCAEAEAALKARFGLGDAHVAPSPFHADGVQTVVGTALGHYLATLLAGPAIRRFGMSWGNTLNLATRFMEPLNRPELEIVSVMGGLSKGSDLNSFEITTRLADLCNARHSYFTAPLYASSAESRDILIEQGVFREVIDKIRAADALAMAAGDMSDLSMLIRDGLPDGMDRAGLAAAGAVGDVLGYFLDAEGRPVDHPINGRVIGITLADLAAIPNVVLAAGGAHKVAILRAVLRLNLVNTLVTDEATAQALLA